MHRRKSRHVMCQCKPLQTTSFLGRVHAKQSTLQRVDHVASVSKRTTHDTKEHGTTMCCALSVAQRSGHVRVCVCVNCIPHHEGVLVHLVMWSAERHCKRGGAADSSE